MTASRSDALVLFGVTGDLAHKMIFPALYAMAKRGDLKVPVIGVASPKWSLANLRNRVKDSIKRSGGIDSQRALHHLLSLLSYVSGDYNDPGTFTKIKETLGHARRPAHYLAIPPSLFPTVITGLGAADLADLDVAALVHSHATRPTGVEITMLTFETDHPSSCGIVELDANAIVVAFHEKAPDPPGRRANGAVYILEPSVLDFLASLHKEAIDLSTEVLPHYLGRIRAEPLVGYLRDVGRPESLALAEEEFPRYLERRSRLQR